MQPWIFFRLRTVEIRTGIIINGSILSFNVNTVSAADMNVITVFAFNVNSVPSNVYLIVTVIKINTVVKVYFCVLCAAFFCFRIIISVFTF